MAMDGQAGIDDKWQRDMRDAILRPRFYDRCFRGSYRFMDGGEIEEVMQRQFKIDTVVRCRGSIIGIDEKIVRWPRSCAPYSSFFLETLSCSNPGRESPGWMITGRADFLLYCMQLGVIGRKGGLDGLDCWLINFRQLLDWFWPRVDEFYGHCNDVEISPNRSFGRLVPVRTVCAAVDVWPGLAPKRLMK